MEGRLAEGRPGRPGRPIVERATVELVAELIEGRLTLGKLFVGGTVVAGGLFKLGNPTKGMLIGS